MDFVHYNNVLSCSLSCLSYANVLTFKDPIEGIVWHWEDSSVTEVLTVQA